MNELFRFDNRQQFRDWLKENGQTSNGIWLLFNKKGGPKTIKADEALEEALCFGWIDGLMQSIDDKTYKKYFSLRRENSKWSKKNKALAEKLERQGSMSDEGRRKIEEAKQNGQWYMKEQADITEEQITLLAEILKADESVYKNFMAMSHSVRKTYTKAYLAAKTEAGRIKRLAWINERVRQNLKPM